MSQEKITPVRSDEERAGFLRLSKPEAIEYSRLRAEAGKALTELEAFEQTHGLKKPPLQTIKSKITREAQEEAEKNLSKAQEYYDRAERRVHATPNMARGAHHFDSLNLLDRERIKLFREKEALFAAAEEEARNYNKLLNVAKKRGVDPMVLVKQYEEIIEAYKISGGDVSKIIENLIKFREDMLGK